MEDTDNEGIESVLDEIKEEIEKKEIEKASNRRMWLLSTVVVADNEDLFVIEGILGVSIRRFRWIVEHLESMKKRDIMVENEAEDILKRAQRALVDTIILSKDYYSHRGDKIKFFDSVAQDHYTLEEIKEKLRLEVKE
jgi:hypothetical protein